MDDKERELLKADLKAEIIKELTGQDLRAVQGTPKPLAVVYAKYKRQLQEKFGIVTWAQAWDAIRKLATIRAGHRYVRDLLPSEEADAAEFAEMILQAMGLSPDE